MIECSMKQDNLVPDGTYLVRDGELINYGERWAYGYFVGVESLRVTGGWKRGELIHAMSDHEGQLFGLWTDSDGDVYLDLVSHVDDREYALALARERGELAVWDVRADAEIRLNWED